MKKTFNLHVNGEEKTVEAEENMPLLWVLRDKLNLVGTKYGCGIAQCGACTVHLNGKATRACVTPIKSIGNAKITTIEGLSEDLSHPVQQAWIAHDVPQCGYCQAGQMMNASALLAENATPSDEEISSGMSGIICRCGTYNRIHAAVKTASDILNA